ncbi:MAG TPA: trehalose-phosphatase, partial [Bryobacteraceae bacterium]|nr:trehalose-phosphatase [Bryobacteraceae bacterium]
LDIPLAGNHGLEISGPRLSFVHAAALGLRPKLRSACDALTRELRRWPGAWVENKGLTATLHFRQIDCSQRGALLFAARRVMGRFGATFALRIGIQCLEIRPRVAWDKGSALARILDEMGPFDACVCLGDDRTDEGMFRSDRAPIGVRVGFADDTAAGYYVPSQDEVPVLLSRIVELAASAALPRARRPANPSHPAVQYAGPAAPLQLSSKSFDSGR